MQTLLPRSRGSAIFARYASSNAKNTQPRRPPPFLPRPLGVLDPPQKLSKEAKKKLSKTEAHTKAQREVLMKEFKTSYFQDFRDIEQTGGKLWLAPETVIRADRSLYFPELSGMSLANKEEKSTTDLLPGKVSLVSVTSTQISAEQTGTFTPRVLQDNSQDPLFQFVQLNLQENPLKSFLLSLFLSNLRKTIPQAQHDAYLLVTQNCEMIREPLGMINKHVGYVFLVDWRSRIRWAAVGAANETPNEVDSLRSCTTVLLERLRSGQDT